MDLKRIDAAIAAYQKRGDAGLDARLGFFRAVWTVMDEHESKAAAWQGASPAADVAAECLQAGMPLFQREPAEVDVRELAAAAAEIAACFAAHEGFAQEARAALAACDWQAFVAALPCDKAGQRPDAFLEAAWEQAERQWGQHASLFASALALALRSQLAPAAKRAARALADAPAGPEGRPTSCPVCGGEATVAVVGPTPSGIENGRRLWCGQCGADWEVERVRCVRCGTRSQTRLHYRSIEGDDAHRVHCCDECEGYVRTRFMENLDRIPLSFEVEDVVMADLDAAMR